MFWIIAITAVVTYLLIDWLIRLPKVGNHGNKHVLITGCRSGFGRDLAVRLDKLGFHVWAAFHTENGVQSLKEECSSRLRTLVLDLTDDASIQAAYATVRQGLPSDKDLWAVISNAGVNGSICFTEMITRQEYMDVCQANLFGPIELARVFRPLLRQSKGRLILMSSICGRVGFAGAPYSVSKFGLECAGDIIRREMIPFGVKVALIEPGLFRTDLSAPETINRLMRDSFHKSSPEVQAVYGGQEPLEEKCKGVKDFDSRASTDVFKVTDAYVEALICKFPRARYLVGTDAKFGALMAWMPDWLSDLFHYIAFTWLL